MESPTSLLAAALIASREPPSYAPLPRHSRARRRSAGALIAVLALVLVAVFAATAAAQDRSIRLLSDGPFPTDPDLGASFLEEAGAQVFIQTDEQLAGNRGTPRRVAFRLTAPHPLPPH
jgi:hypothetical protein